MEDQHLAVAGRSGADPDGGHLERLGQRRSDLLGDSFDHHGEAPGGDQQLGALDQGARAASSSRAWTRNPPIALHATAG